MEIELFVILDPNNPDGRKVGTIKVPYKNLHEGSNVTLNAMLEFAKSLGFFAPLVKEDNSLFGGYIRETGSGKCLVAR